MSISRSFVRLNMAEAYLVRLALKDLIIDMRRQAARDPARAEAFADLQGLAELLLERIEERLRERGVIST